MTASRELVALVQRERERAMEQDGLARVVARIRACCSTSIVDRMIRAVRPAPTTC